MQRPVAQNLKNSRFVSLGLGAVLVFNKCLDLIKNPSFSIFPFRLLSEIKLSYFETKGRVNACLSAWTET